MILLLCLKTVEVVQKEVWHPPSLPPRLSRRWKGKRKKEGRKGERVTSDWSGFYIDLKSRTPVFVIQFMIRSWTDHEFKNLFTKCQFFRIIWWSSSWSVHDLITSSWSVHDLEPPFFFWISRTWSPRVPSRFRRGKTLNPAFGWMHRCIT
jgi:hypothetical protein